MTSPAELWIPTREDLHDPDIACGTLEKRTGGREFPVWGEPVADSVKRRPIPVFFYSNEGDPREPPHVHATAGERVAKFWLDPVELALSGRLRSGEIADLHSIVKRHRREFVEAWNAHFDT